MVLRGGACITPRRPRPHHLPQLLPARQPLGVLRPPARHRRLTPAAPLRRKRRHDHRSHDRVTRRRPPRAPTTSRAALRADADRGLTSTPKDAPAEVVLRRPRLAALRRDHPAARVLPDPLPSARSSRPARAEIAARDRRRHARRARLGHVGEDAPAARRVAATRARSTRFVPFDVSEADPARRRRRDRRASTPASTCTRWSATSSATSPASPAAAGALVAFLGGTIGNLESPSARRVPRARSPPALAARRPPAPRHRPGEGHRPARGGLRRRRRRHRRVQQQRAAL